MLDKTTGSADCFLVQMLARVVSLTDYDARCAAPRVSPVDCLAACARANLSPKLVIEGIPEWVALRSQLAKINALSRATPTNVAMGRRGLGQALKSCGVKRHSRGKRLRVADMKRELRK
eukprot:4221548-Pyramimonas_sp.AAC.1